MKKGAMTSPYFQIIWWRHDAVDDMVKRKVNLFILKKKLFKNENDDHKMINQRP